MLLKVTILLAIVGLSLCATWESHLPEIPKKYAGKKGCYIEEIDEVVDFGTTVTPVGYCYRISCGDNLYYASCGTVLTSEPCYVTKEDLTKAYPACCPRVKCPKKDV